MCVIIYIPQGEKISDIEIEAAWRRNPDGAGFAVDFGDEIYLSRGYMELKEYKKIIKKYMKKYDLMIHCRISTSNAVNELQTHPYAIEDLEEIKCSTNQAISMNGVISGQKVYKGYNDTMSFIKDKKFLFDRVNGEDSTYWGDKITSYSGAKWCIMSPGNTYVSKNFTYVNGVYYSNLIHRKYIKQIKEEKKLINKVLRKLEPLYK